MTTLQQLKEDTSIVMDDKDSVTEDEAVEILKWAKQSEIDAWTQ